MRPNAIIVSLGLAVLQAEGCHPILNTVASDNTSTIHIRDVAPTTTSDAPANSTSAASGPVGIDVCDGSPIRKGPELSFNANKRATIRIVWDWNGKTPTFIGVIVRAYEEDLQRSKVEGIAKRGYANHRRAENTSPPATIHKRDDPNTSSSMFGLLGIVLGDITSAIGVEEAGSPPGW
ncbi:hypothetical protein ACHAPG_004592 [Botrytis cinerea]